MIPLSSRAVAVVVAILAVATSAVVLDSGSYVATLRIERHEPPIERPAQEASLLIGGPTRTVPASRIHASYVLAEGSLLRGHAYKGELFAMYEHAVAKVGPADSRRTVMRGLHQTPLA